MTYKAERNQEEADEDHHCFLEVLIEKWEQNCDDDDRQAYRWEIVQFENMVDYGGFEESVLVLGWEYNPD